VPEHALASPVWPILYALLFWWFSTGVILYLDGLPQRSYRWSMLGASLLALPALAGVAVTAELATPAGAYLAFTCALLVWAWVEMSFLMGFITGPRRTACPPGARGWRRFVYAWQAIAHHELALVASLAAVIALSWGAPNQVAAWTFTALWVMRLSTKFNVFLGVRNLNEGWLPEQLRYLQSYFSRSSMNPLFPFSVTAATVLSFLVLRAGFAAEVPAHASAGLLLVGSLLLLGVLEHWFLILPVSIDRLFGWAFRSRSPGVDGGAASVERGR